MRGKIMKITSLKICVNFNKKIQLIKTTNGNLQKM